MNERSRTESVEGANVTDESIFAVALAIADLAERAAYLDAACAGYAEVRLEVEALAAALDVSPSTAGLAAPGDPLGRVTHFPSNNPAGTCTAAFFGAGTSSAFARIAATDSGDTGSFG